MSIISIAGYSLIVIIIIIMIIIINLLVVVVVVVIVVFVVVNACDHVLGEHTVVVSGVSYHMLYSILFMQRKF